MRITKRQLRSVIREELVTEGFLDWAAEKVGGMLGMKVMRPKDIDDAMQELGQALGTYVISVMHDNPEDGVKEGNEAAAQQAAFAETKRVVAQLLKILDADFKKQIARQIKDSKKEKAEEKK